MLAPDSRALLLESLRPTLGFSLDAAVATTFTLDFAAALVAPLAFAAQEARGAADPIQILEAVRGVANKVDVFCQAGQIRPARWSDLMAFLEPMVHGVKRPKPGHLFHPKVWVLRYVSPEGEIEMRMLCLTRNLTADNNWDAILRLDGTPGSRVQSGNDPLVNLVRALPDMAVIPLEDERRDRIASLAESLRRTEWTYPDGVKTVMFHALGLKAKMNMDFTGYRRLIVAPFVNDAGLATLIPTNLEKTVLVSRPEDLARLQPDTHEHVDCRALSPLAGLGGASAEADEDGAAEPFAGSGLHAKLVVVERNRNAHVFVGSANATDAAFGGNVEFMTELVGSPKTMGVERFLDFDDGFGAILEPFSDNGQLVDDDEDLLARELEQLLRRLAEARFTLHAAPADLAWSLRLTSDTAIDYADGLRLTAELLTVEGRAIELAAGEVAEGHFSGLEKADITPFLVLRASGRCPSEGEVSRATVVRAALVDDPEGRLDEVLARQVNTPEKFLRFLFLLLGLGAAQAGVVLDGAASGDGKGGWTVGPGTGVFELLMRALADQPEAFAQLDGLVERLRATDQGRQILPDGFEALWETFVQARQLLAARRERRTA